MRCYANNDVVIDHYLRVWLTPLSPKREDTEFLRNIRNGDVPSYVMHIIISWHYIHKYDLLRYSHLQIFIFLLFFVL